MAATAVTAWPTYRNLMLTMVLGGLWHGAAWPFVIWGVYQGALLVIYRWAGERWQGRGRLRVTRADRLARSSGGS